jgi:hypothetical protein
MSSIRQQYIVMIRSIRPITAAEQGFGLPAPERCRIEIPAGGNSALLPPE